MPDPAPRKESATKSRLPVIISLLIGGLTGFIAALVLYRAADSNAIHALLFLGVFALSLVAACLAQIIIHEGGHFLFGLMSGYRFVSFTVLGFIWQKGPDGRIHAGRIQIAGAGGQCLMSPPEYRDGSYPFTLYNLGGVVMNLLTSVMFAALALLIPATLPRIPLFALTGVGVFFAILNGLPIPVPAIQNDGKNLLCIRRDAHARRAFWLQMAIAAELARGTRTKDMPEEWFAAFPEEKMDNPIVSTIAVMNTSRLMDAMDLAGAEREICRLLARPRGILGLYQMTMSCDGAVCELIAGRPGRLTASLDTPINQQLLKAMKTFPSIVRTEYALALLRDRDEAKAKEMLEAFEVSARYHPHPQEITGERELLLAIRNAHQKGATQA